MNPTPNGALRTTVSRLLPRRLKSGLRRRLLRFLDAVPASALPPAGAVPTGPRQVPGPAAADLVDPALVGASYTNDEVITFLALENAYLKGQRSAALREAGRQAWDARAIEDDEDGAHAAELAAEYVRGQREDDARERHLVVSNAYPDVGNEYGNGFVHRRVKHYQSVGAAVDVVIIGPALEQRIYAYDGVRVLSGKGPELGAVLAATEYAGVSVHFLNAQMWSWLVPALPRLKLHVFLHGYECCHWIRRIFNIAPARHFDRHIQRTLELQRFWQDVVAHPHGPANYVFVSEWLRRAASDDMEVAFPAAKSHVLHNVVDTRLFSYVPKPPEQRFRLLWVRSAANRNYGSDIAVQCLRELSRSPHWERTSVTVIGDGRYFDEFFDAFGDDPRVDIQRRFASQEEIAALHKDHGILLVPTRLDSQGVSRDEGMASGLVPATNLVAAVPEFVDGDCAVLAPAEDGTALAVGIVGLMDDPGLFQRMSEAAYRRASAQSGQAASVERELELMGMAPSKTGGRT
ncbi:glycosyltransferase family 4 protein [Zafaria sp. J156]|uniref:glycosyltransferase family 4 protein n=1 Tax=Zafaria sp. J156 TaxID=3116490 RepID=UPI002E7815D2|nr:glycosyltransferase family 4 protein [Zafaria sp. J156]MEE1620709.1 glycosyltransferase family 4 protein [Zafaria sp. J156]